MRRNATTLDAVWAACFGASVARQVHDELHAGKGSPDPEEMDRIVGEAEAVADMMIEAVERQPPGSIHTQDDHSIIPLL